MAVRVVRARALRSTVKAERRWRDQTQWMSLNDRVWQYSRVRRSDDPTQGWKIHLSATLLTANTVFDRALPVLRRHDALFKVPVDMALLGHLNSGDSGFSQIGKFLTVYSRSGADAVAIARDLHNVTRGISGPRIPFDAHYRRNSLVYYRYGAYVAGRSGDPAYVVDTKGRPHPDKRAPRTAVPKWLKDPFCGRPRPVRRTNGPIGLDYLIGKVLAQRGKGGVFEALDLAAYPARLVVIKQGRRHGDTDWNGDDGFARVKREGQILRQLSIAGIPVPEVFGKFRQPDDRFLVLEKIPGRPLLPRQRRHPRRLSWQSAARILDELGPLLSKLHAVGWVWRDCKPAHIFRYRGGIRLIDFEGACRIDETDLLPWGSPNYVPPIYHGKFSRQRGTLEDDYALGVIAFQFLAGEFPASSAQMRRSIYRRAGCPASLRARIEDLLRY